MQRSMGLLAAKLGVIVLIALAPMLCIRFCEVRHVVEHQLSADPHYLHHSAHTHEPNAPDAPGHAPLEDAQQMVQSVTDALPMAVAAAAPILMLIALVCTCVPWLRELAFAPPTPPPKLAL